MDDPRIQAALQRGLVSPQALASLRNSVPPHELWNALCARVPQLRTLAQSATGIHPPANRPSDVAPTVVRSTPPPGLLDPSASASSSDVMPTVVQSTQHSSPARPTSSELRQRAVHAYQLARSEDPQFMPHANLVLQPLSELGRGGMGVVHRVRDDRLGREAALKLLSPELSDTSMVARFLREAELTACLDHPAIPPIYEAGTLANGQPFLLMKVIEGKPFSDTLRAAGSRPSGRELRELLEVMVKIGEAVAHAHGRGILHRDLKPANVMVGELGEVMVVDWGLARRFDEVDAEREGQANVQEGLTQAGAVLGTPGYLPPEQADGERVDARADVFALGAILTEVLTGKPPVTGSTLINKIAATLQGKIQSPRDRRRDVPASLDAIARCALAAEREERTETAAEFVKDLRAFLADEPVSVYREGPVGRARRWARRHPAAVAVASVTVAGGLVFGGVAAALISRAEAERGLREEAVSARDQAEQARGEAENAQGVAEEAKQRAVKSADSLTRLQDQLETLLQLARMPEDNAEVVPQLKEFQRQVEGNSDNTELMLRQLARVYVQRGAWAQAANVSMQTALATPTSHPPPFADVFQAYELRTTRSGYDEFVRHEEERAAYFGDLDPTALDTLAQRGWPEATGFPAFAHALRAVSDQDDQDLDLARNHADEAFQHAKASNAPDAVRAAILILQSHIAFHRGEARRGAGAGPSSDYVRTKDFAEAALETKAYPTFAHLMQSMALFRLIRPDDPGSAIRALEASEAALAKDPTLGLAYTVRQRLHRLVGAPPLVIEADYTAALRFRPGDGQLHHFRGQTRLQLAQQNAPPWGTRGWGKRAAVDFEAAIARWDHAASGNGFNVGQLNSRVELSTALALQGKMPMALQVLERCEALAQTAGTSQAEDDAVRGALTQQVGLLLQANQLDAAQPRIERLLQRWPNDPNPHYFQGVAHVLRDNRAGAEAALGRLTQLAPDSPMTRDLRARLAGR